MIGKACVLALALMGSASVALADCKEEMAALKTSGIAKDGTTVPLSDTATPTPQGEGQAAAPETGGSGLAKDGTEAPIGADPGVATSADDAAAQQSGGSTAAEQAAGAAGNAAGGGEARDQALARAEAALEAGDEAACLEALKEVKG